MTSALYFLVRAIYLWEQPPSELYLAANETISLDLTDWFLGELLDFELRAGGDLASLQPNSHVKELSSLQAAGYSLGPAFLLGSQECFARYNSSALQVWCLHVSEPLLEWETSIAVPIEKIQTIEDGSHHFLAYLTVSSLQYSLFLIDLKNSTHSSTQITGFSITSTVFLCSHSLLSVQIEANGNTSLLRGYYIHYPSGSAIPMDVSQFEGELLDVTCINNVQIVTAQGKYIKENFEWDLTSLASVVGTMQGFTQWAKPCIVTSNGLIIANVANKHFTNTELIFIPGGLLAVDTWPTLPQIMALLRVNDTLEIAGYRLSERTSANYYYGRVEQVRAGKVTEIAVVAGIRENAYFMLLNTDEKLYIVRVAGGERLLLVRGSSTPYTAKICAFEYFNRTDTLCITLKITPFPPNSSVIAAQKCMQNNAIMQVNIPISDTLTGEHSILDCFYGPLLQYSLASQAQEGVGIVLKVDDQMEYTEAEYELEDGDYACADVQTQSLQVVIINKGDIRMHDGSDYLMEQPELPEKYKAAGCLFASAQLYFYGLVNGQFFISQWKGTPVHFNFTSVVAPYLPSQRNKFTITVAIMLGICWKQRVLGIF